ncbi:hypothetical protein IV38_GL001964 [Lactobacillus selangorensis]|uniref:Siphovirus-type tail component RIFT-related domain-containing protein n=1 Tax=Lactobacillus selangorensis TaxID=81857 RepID=A0A0R2FIZ3_9LACO|nr:phage tail domain-containing protein [Lactobacillus selangorensis]KRN27750.1 hypothetical protein IV38_GL001964 [Lactobacillus selangorensis]KRN30285.1 hypothetical protein IV40_GL001873 [Lactobacillus selangorensis]
MIDKLFILRDGEPEFEIGDVTGGQIQPLSFDAGAPQPTTIYTAIAGADGEMLNSTTYGPTTATATFFLRGRDIYDYKLQAAKLYSLLTSRNPVRVRDGVDEYKVAYLIAKPITLTPLNFTDGDVTVQFDNPAGYRQSYDRSDQLTHWQHGMNLPSDYIPQYTFTENEFDVFNASDFRVDPYKSRHDLKIIIQGVSGKLTVENQTNGTTFSITKELQPSDRFEMDGVHAMLNGVPDSQDTDFGHIELEKGSNHIIVTGTMTGITFSFPFVYF